MIRANIKDELQAIERAYRAFDLDFLQMCELDIQGVEKHTSFPWQGWLTVTNHHISNMPGK